MSTCTRPGTVGNRYKYSCVLLCDSYLVLNCCTGTYMINCSIRSNIISGHICRHICRHICHDICHLILLIINTLVQNSITQTINLLYVCVFVSVSLPMKHSCIHMILCRILLLRIVSCWTHLNLVFKTST